VIHNDRRGVISVEMLSQSSTAALGRADGQMLHR